MKKCPKCGRTFEDANTLCPSDGSVLARTKDALVGRTLADKYRVEERISEGGMGTVYRGTHILMEKAVAIKVLHPSLAADEKIVARFTREARAASRISHPHALTVTDFGENEDGIVFLVMEYLRGQTLKQIVRAGGPMELERVVGIARQIAGALDAAHAEGVVHRDLKSDNIMLCDTGGTGGDWAKVLDFGIAKIQEPEGGHDAELTAPNLIIGTPQYMSPEQCSNVSGIDYRSDIYSLGIILFEMLAGHVPFTGDSATGIMLKHVQEQPPSLLAERDDVPEAVGAVIARALAKLPEHRQQSAGELSEALALAAEGGVADAVAAVADGNRAPSAEDTNRIVVSTSPNDLRETVQHDYGEETVVRDSGEFASASAPAPVFYEDAYEPPPAASFNPWKVLVPAAVLLVALLGVFFAISSRSGGGGANENGAPLVVDPNALPVETASPPTGAGETGIVPASGQPTPQIVLQPGATPAADGGATPAQPGGTPLPAPSATAEGKQGENENSEGEEEDPKPTPSPTPSATPRRSPSPTPTRESEDPPPPKSTPTPRPTPPAKTEAPSADPPPPAG
ncbi:MAG: protein kinase [Acidobacteria bacterium]|nr:protein kinase [Acidobacteriota bacterium]